MASQANFPAQAALVERVMRAQDVPCVYAIECLSYPFPWSQGLFDECLRGGYVCRVVEQDGLVAGYGIRSMGAGEAHILNLCVDAPWRGQGAGRRLLLSLLMRAHLAGQEWAFLEVRPSNLGARALYESIGFTQVGLRRGYYQAPEGREDALVCRLSLTGRLFSGSLE